MTLLHLVFVLSVVLILALGAVVLLAQKIDSARFCGSCRRTVSGAESVERLPYEPGFPRDDVPVGAALREKGRGA